MTESQSGLKPAEGTEMQARLAGLTWASKYAQCKSLAQIGRWIGYGRLTLPDALAYLAGLAWRPIETCPKNDCERILVRWCGDTVVAIWNADADNWQEGDDGDFANGPDEVTHWQPLPGAPK